MESSISLSTEADLTEGTKELWLKAISAIELRNHDYAMSLLTRVLEEDPKFLDGRKAIRKAAALKKGSSKGFLKLSGGGLSKAKWAGKMKKDPLSAILEIEKALEKDPFSLPTNEALYDAAMMAGMPETAAFALETIKEGSPDNTQNLHKLAEHHIKHENPDAAQKIYENIVRLDPTDMDAVKGAKDASAQSSMKKQRWDEATGMRELMKDDEEASELESQNRAAMTPEQVKAQIEELGSQYEEKKEDLAYAKQMAGLYEKIEDLPNAISWYQWAFNLSDSDPALERRISLLSEREGELSLKRLEQEIEENPHAPDVEEKRAVLEAKRMERANTLVAEARKRVEKNPTDKTFRFDLGQNLFEAGEYTEAIPELQQARSNPHIRTRSMLLLGRCYAAKNMLDLAAGQLKEAASEMQAMDTTKKELVYELGLTYEKMGNAEEALACFKEIYESDYGYRDVAKRVEDSYGNG